MAHPRPARSTFVKLLLIGLLAAMFVTSACAGDDPDLRSEEEQQQGGELGDENEHDESSRMTEVEQAPGAPRDVSLALRQVVSGLSSPLDITHAGDGSGRLFVVEQAGTIRILRRGRLRARPFLDITSRVRSGGEQGLLGLAFHPRFSQNRRFFVNYTDTGGDTVIAEYKRARDSMHRAAPRSERILLRIDQPFSNHNGGALEFGPDGYLYVATGDGGGAGDPSLAGQRLDTHLGKILRLDVSARAGRPYGVPEDNPFVDRPQAEDEIWLYGLRNPWRISFDRATGALWIADVGQNAIEEVNRVPRGEGGLNLGWNLKEGDRCFAGAAECEAAGLFDPMAVYGREGGCAVTGGYVYRGRAIPAFAGTYFFGDYCSGIIWGLASRGPDRQEAVELLRSDHSISSFGENQRGELFLTDLRGAVMKLVEKG